MQITQDDIRRTCPEADIYNELLALDGKHILELGCGSAMLTRAIAEEGHDRRITATEVDEIQHNKNLNIKDLPNVSFELAGAEQIPLDDNSVDIVMMFKSLHHVPGAKLAQAMGEIRRVLKPGGVAYFSEPIYAGDFNAMMSIFHDERRVREEAFAALQKAVANGLFQLKQELFFNLPVFFENFREFEGRVLNATHTEHRLDDETYHKVKQQFLKNMKEDGAHFTAPMRVDLLQKPG